MNTEEDIRLDEDKDNEEQVIEEEGIDGDVQEEENVEGKVLQFPSDAVRMPEPLLPRPIGRIPKGHPLIRPLIAILIIFLVLLIGHFLYVVLSGTKNRDVTSDPNAAISYQYRETGAITWQGKNLHGWFLDSKHEHFMSEDGRRFTFVNSHTREDSTVTGYWREIR